MVFNRRFSILLVAALAFVVVFLVAGLPFARLGMTSVNAQYVGPNALDEGVCGGNLQFQVRLNAGEIVLFTGPELTNFAVIIPDAFWQKYLMCGNADTRADGAVSVLFPGNAKLWVRSGDVASIVPRDFTDTQ